MLKRPLYSQVARTLLWVMLLVLVAIGINVLGIRLLGGTISWSHWLTAHREHFLMWRICLYGAVAYGWWRMRSRIARCEVSPDTKMRLGRAEIGAAIAILALEAAALLRSV